MQVRSQDFMEGGSNTCARKRARKFLATTPSLIDHTHQSIIIAAIVDCKRYIIAPGSSLLAAPLGPSSLSIGRKYFKRLGVPKDAFRLLAIRGGGARLARHSASIVLCYTRTC